MSSRPNTVEDWVKHLEGVRLPVATASAERLRRALADGRLALHEIAERLCESPPLALALLREANRGHASFGDPAASLEAVLGRVGLGPAEYLIARQPTLSEERLPRPLRQLCLVSQHAMTLGLGLFGVPLARLWPDIRLAALLFLAPLWPLATRYPELFEEWERRVLGEGEPALRVERELLGVPAIRLCQALARHWQLPEWIVEGYRLLDQDRRQLVRALHIAHGDDPLEQQQRLDDDPNLRRWLTHPGNTILLANGLALASHQAWDGPHTLRWQRFSALYLQLPLARVQSRSHELAVQDAQRHARPGLWHPAEGLVWPPGERRLKPVPRVQVASESQAQRWRGLCEQLLHTPSAFATLPQLFDCARQALVACGLPRLLLLTPDRNGQKGNVQLHHGLDDAPGLQLDIASHPLLAKLFGSPGQLRIDDDNRARFAPHLPADLRRLFSNERLWLRSLGFGERVVLVAILDSELQPADPRRSAALDKTFTCIERAIGTFANRPRARPT